MALRILAIDPGPDTSGVVLYEMTGSAASVLWADKAATRADIVARIDEAWAAGDILHVACERCTAGQYALNSLLRTSETGGYLERAAETAGMPWLWMTRSQVLTELHVSGGSRDSQVRRRMIELHGGTKGEACGTKAAPGPLYGVTSHAWQALGLAVAAHRRYAREGLWC